MTREVRQVSAVEAVMLQDWEWAFLDAVIAKDFTEALRIYYRNEGEQISMWEV